MWSYVEFVWNMLRMWVSYEEFVWSYIYKVVLELYEVMLIYLE